MIFLDPATNRSYTYAQTKQSASDFGKGLKSLWDWQTGDVLALYTPNSIDTPIVTWGCHFAGGVVSPANPAYTAEELAFQLKDSGAQALLTQVPNLPIAEEACRRVGIPTDRIALIGDERDTTGRIKHFTSVRNTSGTARYRRHKPRNPAEDLAFLVYSSGTTGHPKGVMLTHKNIVSNTLQICSAEQPLSPESRPSLPDGDRILAFLPFFHIYGLTVVLHQSFYRGLTTVVMPKFDLESWCKLCLLYTSPSPRDGLLSRMPSSA